MKILCIISQPNILLYFIRINNKTQDNIDNPIVFRKVIYSYVLNIECSKKGNQSKKPPSGDHATGQKTGVARKPKILISLWTSSKKCC